MNTEKNLHKNYEHIAYELKHLTNSFIRMLILLSLFESSKSMKEIKEDTNLTYSAISINIRLLEVEEYVIRKERTYDLSNIMKLYLINLINFDKVVCILNKFFNIFENHKVRSLPMESILELNMLENSKLIESCGIEFYKINEIILDTVKKSKELKAILPLSFADLTQELENFVKTGKKTELKISYDIVEDITKNMDLESSNINIEKFVIDFNFLLIITDNSMILGFYKKSGKYDQNRILFSKSKESLKWANRLFQSI